MKFCPNCNSKLIIKNIGRDHIIKCTNCGYEISSTNSSSIDFDSTIYVISVEANNNVTLEKLKFISKTMGANFIEAKRILCEGSIYFKGYAIEIIPKRNLLVSNGIDYQITPHFPY